MKYNDLIQELEKRKWREETNLQIVNDKFQKKQEKLESKKSLLKQVEADASEFEHICKILENSDFIKEARKDFWYILFRNVLEAAIWIPLVVFIIEKICEIVVFSVNTIFFGGLGLVIGAIKIMLDKEVKRKWKHYKNIRRLVKEKSLSDVQRSLDHFTLSKEYLQENIRKIEEDIRILQIDIKNKQKLIAELNERLIAVMEQLKLAIATPEVETVLDKHFEENMDLGRSRKE